MAFQINSWNEKRKTKYLEKQYLINISSEINSSVVKLDEAVKFNELTLRHIENILYHEYNHLEYSPSLDTSFYIYQYFRVPELNYTTYETVKNVGLNSINPQILRLDISKLYEEDFRFITNSIRANEQQFYQNVVTPFHIDNFKEISYEGITIPNNYKHLKESQKYINIVNKLKGIRIYTNNSLKSVQKKTSALLVRIDARINEL